MIIQTQSQSIYKLASELPTNVQQRNTPTRSVLNSTVVRSKRPTANRNNQPTAQPHMSENCKRVEHHYCSEISSWCEFVDQPCIVHTYGIHLGLHVDHQRAVVHQQHTVGFSYRFNVIHVTAHHTVQLVLAHRTARTTRAGSGHDTG